MKSNYNPYTVPENFFEDTCRRAVNCYRNRRRALLFGAAAVAAAALIVATPSFIKSVTDQDSCMEETVTNNLAMMYEYDIFLQVNF